MNGVDYITVEAEVVNMARGINLLASENPPGGEDEVTGHLNWDSNGFSSMGWYWGVSGNGIQEWYETHIGASSSTEAEFLMWLETQSNLDDAFDSWQDGEKVAWVYGQGLGDCMVWEQ